MNAGSAARGAALPGAATGPAGAPAARWAAVAVWGIWLFMMLVALGAIARYGRNIPLAEDWFMVPPLTGNEPDIAGWLWSQNNEHRVPLARLLYLLLLKATGGDFRVGMVFNVLASGALAAAMMRTAYRLRGGRTSLADAFFPIAFLHLGNWNNLVWGWQIQFVLATLLTCALLLVAALRGTDLRPRDAWLAGTCLLLLPLTGANGLIFVAVMAPWAALSARELIVRRRTGGSGAGAYLAGCIAVAIVLSGLYFVGYERPSWNPPSPGIGPAVETAVKFLAMGWGPAAELSWRASALLAAAAIASAVALMVTALARQNGHERGRAFGLLSFAAGMTILALAIGWGRAAMVPSVGMPDRYALLSLPALCMTFFTWQLYGSPGWRRPVQLGLLAAMLALLPANTREGLEWRDWYSAGMLRVEADLAAGMTSDELARRNGEFLIHFDRRRLPRYIEMLRQRETGPFAARPVSPPQAPEQ